MTNTELWITHFRSVYKGNLRYKANEYSDAEILHIAFEQYNELFTGLVDDGVFDPDKRYANKQEFLDSLEEMPPDTYLTSKN